MANLFYPKERRVLPNWRNFGLTVGLGELDDFQVIDKTKQLRLLTIDDYISAWEKNKTVAIAGDLLSAAFVNNLTDRQEAKDAAYFVISNPDKGTIPLITLAEKIIGNVSTNNLIAINHENLEDCIDANDFGKSIRDTKIRLRQFPVNPILYVELSRLYANIGNREKALKNMSIALQLAPENRFVLRAASRLYTHFDLIDRIYWIIERSEIVKHDPWVMSTEIALATIMQRNPKFMKKGLQALQSGRFSPFSLAELSASIATIEFFAGDNRGTKKFLQQSLVLPNDNSLAQTEWILDKIPLFDFDIDKYTVPNRYEALALNDYRQQKWNDALTNSVSWYCDLPFSKQPVMFGAHIAGDLLDEPRIARKLLRNGLKSHQKDPEIINNLAYSLALENRIDEAESYLNEIPSLSNINQIARICLTATFGLILYRKGLPQEGRAYYSKAIDATRPLLNKKFMWLAQLNLAREELLSQSERTDLVINQIEAIPSTTDYPEVNKLKAAIQLMIKKHQVP